MYEEDFTLICKATTTKVRVKVMAEAVTAQVLFAVCSLYFFFYCSFKRKDYELIQKENQINTSSCDFQIALFRTSPTDAPITMVENNRKENHKVNRVLLPIFMSPVSWSTFILVFLGYWYNRKQCLVFAVWPEGMARWRLEMRIFLILGQTISARKMTATSVRHVVCTLISHRAPEAAR
jgi:hypothetical protein